MPWKNHLSSHSEEFIDGPTGDSSISFTRTKHVWKASRSKTPWLIPFDSIVQLSLNKNNRNLKDIYKALLRGVPPSFDPAVHSAGENNSVNAFKP